mmetsp:Transcript_40709/g.88959  ORF Transcript_40709/g.88959 Transcript_40709/m.88959 type:complete len:370 (-) Transcript_40709:48-1157(-)
MLEFLTSSVRCQKTTCLASVCTTVEMEDRPGIGELGHDALGIDEDHGFEKTVRNMVTSTFPAGPKTRAAVVYSSHRCQELRDKPVHSGRVLYLCPGKPIIDVLVSVHVNGFRIAPRDVSDTIGVGGIFSWSPFFLVEKHTGTSSFWAVFKLAALRFEGEEGFYFAVTGPEARSARERWVQTISKLLRQLIASLFPAHTIAVQPLPGVRSTSTRIMAGYLLRCRDNDISELIYSELHAYICGEAHLRHYKDELCQDELDSIRLTDRTVVSTRKGCYCSVFGVDEYLFCARTEEEKDLWLRAVSNIKVKLMFHAPDPTGPDLDIIRESVFQSSSALGPIPSEPPMLPVIPRVPPLAVAGDVHQLEPMEDTF